MYILPYSEEEFEEKHYSGDYKALSKVFKPGDLVSSINKGPIFKPAKLRRIGIDGKADIEYSEFNQKEGSTQTISATVSQVDIAPYQLAGPNIFIDKQTSIPKSIIHSTYDQEFEFYIYPDDLEAFCDAMELRANAQFRNKLRFSRLNPGKNVIKEVEIVESDSITGQLLITIVSARNLTSRFGTGDTYVEVLTQKIISKGTESQRKGSKSSTRTEFQSFAKTIIFDEEKDIGTFVKGELHDITFLVKQENGDKDVELGIASIKSDELLDPYKPAREYYLLLDDPPHFAASLYLNVLFVPTHGTLKKMRIQKPISSEFDEAYHEWIISKNIIVDDYGFVVPIGKYHPILVNTDELHLDEDDEEMRRTMAEGRRSSKTPEKRVQYATEVIPSLRTYNLELKDQCDFRPDYEEILYHFRQIQMYLNNEAKAKANQARQEYCWNDFLIKVTENVHDMSEQSDNEADDYRNETRGHMFSVAGRSHWDNKSWQNEDIWALCRLGISPSLRSRVWYDLLEAHKLESTTVDGLKNINYYDNTISPYENLKILSVQNYNVAFAQIDEDMNTFNISNTPSRDDRGRVKNILK